jgi:hypothetical protein
MRRNRGLLVLAIALIIGGLVVFYFSYYYGREGEKQATVDNTVKPKSMDREERDQEEQAVTAQKKTKEVSGEQGVENQTTDLEDECRRKEKELMEFLAYLDKKDYIRKLGIEEDMHTHFRKMIHRLSSNPPTPAGEGLKIDTIIKNIYHFYRALGLQELRLIRLILENEADTLEMNLAALYPWLMSADRCSQKDGLPPSLDTIYRYAGFLVNSIGGRAYLFRRETRLRLLVNYYCILIIHEADKRKMNSFGVDITPFLEPLAEEIENYQFLYYRKKYAGKLIDLKNYYAKKRKVS